MDQVEWGEVVFGGRKEKESKEVGLDSGDMEGKGSLLPYPAEVGSRNSWEGRTDLELISRSDQERWKGEMIGLKQVSLSLLSKDEKSLAHKMILQIWDNEKFCYLEIERRLELRPEVG